MDLWRLEWGSLTRPGFARMGMWLARPRWCDGSPRMEWYMGATIYSKHATLQPRSSRPFQLLANKCATLSTFFLEVWSIFPFIWLTSMTRTVWRDQNFDWCQYQDLFFEPKKDFLFNGYEKMEREWENEEEMEREWGNGERIWKWRENEEI